jgi:hypothetical protein
MRIGAPLLLLVMLTSTCLFGQVGSAELIARARELDGREVEFVGEAIGESMRRGDHVWLNLLDAGGAIGIWASRVDLPAIRCFGSAAARGDTLRVRGIFHRSCPEHGGDLDIHAVALEVVARGELKAVALHPGRMALAAGLLLAAAAVFFLWRAKQRARERA